MGKKLGGNSWLTALRRVFRSLNKDSNTGRKSRQCNQDEEEEKEREKRRRWLFRKAAENNVQTAATAAVEIISLTPPSSRVLYAATVIQTAFRGYLAKRALIALKGIVKLQALIRGQNVRRQAQTTFKCMQALFRVQARVREQCDRISHDAGRKSMFAETTNLWEYRYLHDIRERKSISKDQCSVVEAWRNCPPTRQELEVMLQAQKAAFIRERSLSHALSKQAGNSGTDLVDGEERTNWLDDWMSSKQGGIGTRTSTHRRNPAKTVEIDSLKSNVRRSQHLSPRHKSASSPHSAASPCRYQKSLCNSTVLPPATPSPSKPKPVQMPPTSPRRLDKSYSTANTPRFCPTNRSINIAPRYSTSGIVPSYMAATESTKARVRSRSAPRQRPSTPERGGSAKKCLSYSISQPYPLSKNLKSPSFKNGQAGYVGMEQQSDYSCNADSIGGEISPCSTTNLRW